jgi:outer membrane lipoprotein-sorting protein
MRLRRVSLAAGVLLLCAPLAASAQSVDDLVSKHVAARGGLAAMHAIAILTGTGKMRVPGFDAVLGYRQILARPDSARLEVTLQGLTAVQAYDGTTAWQIQPFQGRKDPEKVGADDAKALQEAADFDDALVDYKVKGNVVDFLGTEDVDGAPAYALRAKLKNGDEQIYYLDPDAMLTVRVVTKQFVRGAQTQNVSDYGDYEKVAGVWFPFEVSSGPKGSSARTLITFDSIVANGPAPASLFVFPQGH